MAFHNNRHGVLSYIGALQLVSDHDEEETEPRLDDSNNTNNNNNTSTPSSSSSRRKQQQGQQRVRAPCPVYVCGDLDQIDTKLAAASPSSSSSSSSSSDAAAAADNMWKKKVDVFSFQDFESLKSIMTAQLREAILRQDNDDSGAEDGSEEEDGALQQLHRIFQPVVQEIVQSWWNPNHNNYHSHSHDVDETNRLHPHFYASPTLRAEGSTYAEYLHNDMLIRTDRNLPSQQHGGENLDAVAPLPVAMVNVWFVLNETPPSNQLVFLECNAEHVQSSHMAHALYEHVQHRTVHYSQSKSYWGYFYCFISGERKPEFEYRECCYDMAKRYEENGDGDNGEESTNTNTGSSNQMQHRYLLHGALNLPPPLSSGLNETEQPSNVDNGDDEKEARRSVEMRYLIYQNVLPPPPNEEEEEDNERPPDLFG